MSRANVHLHFAALLLFAHGVAAAEGSTEFTLNLFTDIAPILALFGEQFAQQYLSQSFTWLDHLIFACIPLGIITALSGAIRTRGPRLTRSFIGRARENLATVEIGLMSSVSHEIVIFPDIYDAVRRGESNDASCGIHTLQTASQSWASTGPLLVRSKYQGKTYRRLQRLLDPEKHATKDQNNQPFDFKCPPNLQLNVSTGQSSRTRKTAELFVASTAAVALQLSLLAIAAVVAYHGPTSKVIGYENNRYGFPCYVAGSAFLCAGMAICSAAIESSTDEFVWTRSEENIPKAARDSQSTRNPSILWIQQPQSVGDQTFESYAILGGLKPYILTSSRSRDLWTTGPSRRRSGDQNQSKRRWWEVVTMVGVLLGSLGFIVQFIGLRGLPWPVAVCQLLAIVIMALIRAIIRRGVGVIPLACAALPGYELDFLAAKIVFYPEFREFKCGNPSNGDMTDKALSDICRWKVMTANKERRLTAPTNFRPGRPVDNIGQMYVREGNICSVEDMGSDTGSDTLSTEDSDDGYLPNNSSQQLVEVRERLGDLCKWKTSITETAVALVQSVEHFMTIFFKGDKLYEIPWAIKTSNIGCEANGDVEETTLLVQKKHGKWVADLGMVEAMLSLWMASIEAQQLDIKEKRDATDNLLDPRIGDWRRSGGAKVKFSRIIGDPRRDLHFSSLQCDISLWVAKDLRNEWHGEDDSHYWGESNGPNLLIGFDTPLKGNPEHQTYVVKDSHRLASDWQCTNKEQPDIFGWSPIHYLAAGTTLSNSSHLTSFIMAIKHGMAYSCLEKSHRSPFHIAASSGRVGFLKTCFGVADTEALKATLCTGGLDGRTPLHLAVEGGHQECVNLLLKHLVPRQGDIWGRTPVHLAAIGQNYAIGRELLAHFSEPLKVDKLGNTPLTYLLRNENDKTVEQGRADFARDLMATWKMDKVDDGSGNSLLHYAAAFSDEDAVETLVKELGNVNILNRQGQTPLHLACLEGRTAVVRKLISLGAQVRSLDDKGWNVLHYAADCRGAELDLVSSILEVKEDIINTRTIKDSCRTPVQTAAAAGNALVAMLLVSKGAHLNSRDKGGDTALQLALKKDLKETIDILLSCYEVLEIWKATDRDSFGHVNLAIRRYNTECLGILLLHIATTMPMRIHGLKVMVTDRRWKSEDAKLFDLVFNSIPQQQLSILDLSVLVRVSPTAKSSEVICQAWHFRRRNLAALRDDPWALHVFAQHGDTATVTELLEAGADPSCLDEDNWMPSEAADRCGQTAVRDLLREHLVKTKTERHDRPPYRVPKTIRNIYQDPDIIIEGDGSAFQGSYDIRATLGNPEFPCAIFRTEECIPPDVEHYYFEVRVVGDSGQGFPRS
ncbi:hypothetical protein CEP54_015327 [Fusarium duplospermum]|uniref:Ankyrin repeat protein n=1 Tax=Fusarium duplospermum TaxID=1325734 RepID=A0A428NQ21_9HYPO|nr:hypothetical protein CEP54_015327 [Fusarium duplospermum]